MEVASRETHLYEQVADKMTRLIEKGTLKPGEKLPSVRKLSLQMGVSISTVLQSYLRMEDRGTIEARPKSGYYVRERPRELPPEPKMSSPSPTASTVDIGELLLEVHDAIMDPGIVPLGAATPNDELLPTRKLYRLLGTVARRHEAASNRYDSPQGNPGLRRQIARRGIDWGGTIVPDDIVITFGCTEALNLCLRAVTREGDTVAVESPVYFGFLQILESLRLKALEIPTHPREGMSTDALASALKKQKIAAVFLSANFQNPLGSCMSDERKVEIVRLLASRGIPLLEDDVYGDLYFGNARPKALKAFDREENVLLCSSFSKTISPGFRIGWTIPGRHIERVRRLKLSSTISTATLPQMAIAEMLANGGYDHYLRGAREAYRAQADRMIQAVKRYFPEGTSVTRPAGGTVLWVEFPEGIDSVVLYRRALEKNISIVPGPLFSPKRQYGNCIRLNCGNTWSERTEEAMITLGRLAERMT
ncbi:MAG TPA: PLP-dependent aminotransferase family protein [Bacteroidota bacterium]|nr:PLP-dependent aminotransferase family protein [Bacteroidota bacterium]